MACRLTRSWLQGPSEQTLGEMWQKWPGQEKNIFTATNLLAHMMIASSILCGNSKTELDRNVATVVKLGQPLDSLDWTLREKLKAALVKATQEEHKAEGGSGSSSASTAASGGNSSIVAKAMCAADAAEGPAPAKKLRKVLQSSSVGKVAPT